MGYRDEKIAELETAKKEQLEEMSALYPQIRFSGDGDDKLRLEKKLDWLAAKYENTTNEIERLRKGGTLQTSPERLRVDLISSLQRKLPFIDFNDAEVAFQKLLGQFQDCDGAVVLIQSSEHRMGNLYLQRVRELLMNKGGIHHFPTITFTSNDQATKDELIARMYQYSGLTDNAAQEDYSARLVELAQRLLNAVDAGRSLLLEISCEETDATFIKWLIHDFWTIFRNELLRLGPQKGRMRVIIFLVVHFEFECDDELLPHICNDLDGFQNQMIFEISLLIKWEETLIKSWLFEQLADELDYYGYPRSNLPNLARRVMQRSDGSPRQVCNEFTGTTLDWIIKQLIPTDKVS